MPKPTFRDVRALFDDRAWRDLPALVGVSIGVGLAKGMILALANEAVARYSRGEPHLWHGVAMAVLLVLAMAGGLFTSVRAQTASSALAVRLRQRVMDRLTGASLRSIERVGADRLHWHFMSNITLLAHSYEGVLSFLSAVVMLAFNLAYIGWLSPLGLAAALAVSVLGVMIHLRQEHGNEPVRAERDRLWTQIWSGHREYIDGYKELKLSHGKLADFRRALDADQTAVQAAEVTERRNTVLAIQTTYFFQIALVGVVVFALPSLARLDGVTILQLLAAVVTTVAPLESVVSQFPALARARLGLSHLLGLDEELAQAGAAPGRHVPAGASLPIEPLRELELREVEFVFREPDGTEGFHMGPVSLKVRQGEVVFVCGGNGSGKTVLMRVLTGLYPPAAGRLLLNGREVAAADMQAWRERFTTVFNDFHLFRALLGQRGVPPELVQPWLERMDLADRTGFHDGAFDTVALSAGQRKRLALIVAWLEDREVYVLDEFGAEQDPVNRRRFYDEWLPLLRQLGKAVVVVSHDDAYFDRCDRLVRMDFGRVVWDGPPAAHGHAPHGGTPSPDTQVPDPQATAAVPRTVA